MDCVKFQDSISDYLDGALDSRQRTECAAHRLTCRECRELYTDVRATVKALGSAAAREVDEPEGLEKRIIAATTAGEMLSCGDFDRIIERYFDGVVLAPTYQTFQAHFEKCAKCRRLMAGIEETIAMCREIKQTEVEAPDSLNDRILAATVGNIHEETRRPFLWAVFGPLVSWFHVLWTPQMAVAALIFAASSLLILSRFGSVSGMASQGKAQAAMIVENGQRALNQTGALARMSFLRVSDEVNTLLLDGPEAKRQPNSSQPQQKKTQQLQPSKSQPAFHPSPQPSPGSPQ